MPDYIPSDEMYKYIDCRYTGVVIAARRARQLMSEDPTSSRGKPLLRAFEDLMNGRLQYRFVDPMFYDEDYLEALYWDQAEQQEDSSAQDTAASPEEAAAEEVRTERKGKKAR